MPPPTEEVKKDEWNALRKLGYGVPRTQWAYNVVQRINEAIALNPTANPAEVARPIAASIFGTDPKLWAYLAKKYGFQ